MADQCRRRRSQGHVVVPPDAGAGAPAARYQRVAALGHRRDAVPRAARETGDQRHGLQSGTVRSLGD